MLLLLLLLPLLPPHLLLPPPRRVSILPCVSTLPRPVAPWVYGGFSSNQTVFLTFHIFAIVG